MSRNDVERSGNRHGDDAVLAADGAVAVYELGHDHAADAEVVEKHRHRHDVDDGVDRADLVEVHLGELYAVGLGLPLR